MPKRTLQGVVVSDKQDKTVIVRVERRITHPVLKKTVRKSKKSVARLQPVRRSDVAARFGFVTDPSDSLR